MTTVIIQARMGSTRLPGKVMMPIDGRPVLAHVVERVKRAKLVDEIWLACPEDSKDDGLAAFAETLGVLVFRGEEEDVLSRFVGIAQKTGAETFVRITADCPMVDGAVIDAAIQRYSDEAVDYLSNGIERSFPDGLDVEVFSRAALLRAGEEADHPFLRAHVTPYIHGRLKAKFPWGNFKVAQLVNEVDFSHLRWTLDEPEDFEFLNALIPNLPEGYGWMQAVTYLTQHPELLTINKDFGINEGTTRDIEKYANGSGDDAVDGPSYEASNVLFKRAQAVIPLASQTFSKSFQQWVRGVSPLFVDHAKGAVVTDPDGNSYVDYLLALMPVILGYCDDEVDMAIRDQLDKGIIFSLASPLELELAETLCRIIPCAEQVRFGKNGSDATAAAVRLARACTGRDRVVVCGYHGWHDWYIGTTTRDLGVPQATKALTSTVPFNDLSALEDLFTAGAGDDIACVMMEPTSKSPAQPGYLEGVRALTEKHGSLLIFDEIITGFRVSLGGAQAVVGVTPDLATFGKSMANGMPISAVVGRKDYMRAMEDIFFSGTFGGETLSLAAAMATIERLEREDIPQKLSAHGEHLMTAANDVIAKVGLAEVLTFSGESWWPRLEWLSQPIDGNLATSLFRQNMVAEGLLLASSLNLCDAHRDEAVVSRTLESLSSALVAFHDDLNATDPTTRLRGLPIQPTFAVRS